KLAPQSAEEAKSRLMSGLRLLETELPLSEAIVFWRHNDSFEPAARLRTSGNTGQLTGRNSAWREGISLCESATLTREIITQVENGGRAINVAVPLRHENTTVGALLLRLNEELRDEDRPLLTAVGAQMSRNLQRDEYCKAVSQPRVLDYFSSRVGEKKLQALYVLNGLLTEQRCGENVLADVTEA